jgi:hypothetical protein
MLVLMEEELEGDMFAANTNVKNVCSRGVDKDYFSTTVPMVTARELETLNEPLVLCGLTWHSTVGDSTRRRRCTARSDSTSRRGTRSLQTLRLKRSWVLAFDANGAGVACHGTSGRACVGNISGHGACRLADNLPPLVGGLWCMCLELYFVADGEAAAQLASRDVFTLDVELLPVHSADHAVGQV